MLVVLAIVAVGCGGEQPEQLADAEPASAPLAADSDVDTSAKSAAERKSGAGSATDQGNAGAQSDDDGSGASHAGSAATGGGDGNAESTADTDKADAAAGPDPAAPADPADKGNAPPVAAEPDMDAVDVSATLSRDCVRPGQAVTITVQTSPNAGVAYVAMYSDGQGGGPPPYGANYGGNDGGMAGEQGRYSDTWTVAANAPSGKGSVDVLVGTTNSEYGETSVPFAVADPLTGVCA